MNKENMKIIGLENCGGCNMVHEKFPNVKYIMVKKQCADDIECRNIKKVLSKFNIEHFPALFNEDFTEMLPLETLNT